MDTNEQKSIEMIPNGGRKSIIVSAWEMSGPLISIGPVSEGNFVAMSQNEFIEFINACKRILEFSKVE